MNGTGIIPARRRRESPPRRAPRAGRPIAPGLGLLACLSGVPVGLVRADGGAVCGSTSGGPLAVTTFTSPTPLRVGPADLSVLVQDRKTGATLLDGEVEIRLEAPPEGPPPLGVVATAGAATNRLLRAVTVQFPVAGPWRIRTTFRRDSDEATLDCAVEVIGAESPASGLWPYLALPPLAVFVFALHQWLRRRRSDVGEAPHLRGR